MEDLCVSILILLVPCFRPSVFRVVHFFYISIYWGYYTLTSHDFKANIQEEKKLQDDKAYNQKQHFKC